MRPHFAILIPMLLALLISLVFGWPSDGEEIMAQTDNCLICHDDQAQSLERSAHRLRQSTDLPSAFVNGCIQCHDGWEKHLEEPGPENIARGPELTQAKQAEICARCHQTEHQTAMRSGDPHGLAGLTCTACHKIHGNPADRLVLDQKQNFCQTCHQEIAAQFKNRSRHPLEAGNIRCTDCHQLREIKDHDRAAGLDWRCQECHSEVAGPYIYEHPVSYTHLVDGAGCTECHQPHGSPNDRLLKQPASGTCLQCHLTPPGHRTAHAGLGSRHPCRDCHADIHGSNNNRLFLNPDLGSELVVNCYESGCHNLER